MEVAAVQQGDFIFRTTKRSGRVEASESAPDNHHSMGHTPSYSRVGEERLLAGSSRRLLPRTLLNTIQVLHERGSLGASQRHEFLLELVGGKEIPSQAVCECRDSVFLFRRSSCPRFMLHS